MKSNPKLHLCRSNRHIHHDYSAQGFYYITLNTQNSESFLGIIENDKMILSDLGEIIQCELLKIPEYNKRIILDEWIIMPNHIHVIIQLGGYDFDNGISNIGGPVARFMNRTYIVTPNNIEFIDVKC